ncbi:MAG: PIN domain-containing protein [Armatimonadetes bacterium]|nr:PIN domain-containing protein [Armatimonadota bacterium]
MSGNLLAEFLFRHRKIGLDTSIFIYEVGANPKYLSLTSYVFGWLEQREASGVTSTLTMLELLVQPYRLSDIDSVNKFYALLSTYPNLAWIEPTLEIADLGAKLRAENNLRTPDAIQAATALACRATGFLTNDPVFQGLGGLEVAILDKLLAA